MCRKKISVKGLFLFISSIVWLQMVSALAGCGDHGGAKANPMPPMADTLNQQPNLSPTKKNIVFFGNSLTAGYGLDLSEAFPSLIQYRIDSLKLPYKVINAGLSGETSAGGRTRVDWILRQPLEIFVLELGGNDGLRGIPATDTYKNLQLIIDKVRSAHSTARILLTGIQIPPSMGNRYASEFSNIFPKLAKANKIALVPFLLEGVGGVPGLNQADGIHPTAPGDIILADNVWKVLKDML
jgi:acyl-CoA thioesterase-1